MAAKKSETSSTETPSDDQNTPPVLDQANDNTQDAADAAANDAGASSTTPAEIPGYGPIPTGEFMVKRTLSVRLAKDQYTKWQPGTLLTDEQVQKLCEIAYENDGKTALETINRYLTAYKVEEKK